MKNKAISGTNPKLPAEPAQSVADDAESARLRDLEESGVPWKKRRASDR